MDERNGHMKSKQHADLVTLLLSLSSQLKLKHLWMCKFNE